MSEIDDILKGLDIPKISIVPQRGSGTTELDEIQESIKPSVMDILTVAGRRQAASIPLRKALTDKAVLDAEEALPISDEMRFGLTLPRQEQLGLKKLPATQESFAKRKAEVDKAIESGFETYRTRVADWIPEEEATKVDMALAEPMTAKTAVPKIVNSFFYNLSEILTSMAPAVAGGLSLGPAGGLAGGLAGMTQIGAAEATGQYERNFEFGKAMDIDDKLNAELSAKHAIAYGIESGLTESGGNITELVNIAKMLRRKPGWATLAGLVLTGLTDAGEESLQTVEGNRHIRGMAADIKKLTGKYDQEVLDKFVESPGEAALIGGGVGILSAGAPATMQLGEYHARRVAKYKDIKQFREERKYWNAAEAEVRAAYDAFNRRQEKVLAYQAEHGDNFNEKLSDEQRDELAQLESIAAKLPKPTPEMDRVRDSMYQGLLRKMPNNPSEAMAQANFAVQVNALAHQAAGRDPEEVFSKLTIELNKQPPNEALEQSFDSFYRPLADYFYKQLKGTTENADKYAGNQADNVVMQLGRARTKAEVEQAVSVVRDKALHDRIVASWKEPKAEQLTLLEQNGQPTRLPYYSSLGEAITSGAMKLPLETKLEGKQILGRLSNFQGISPDELNYFKQQGLAKFLEEARTPKEVAAWLQSRRPQVEVKKLLAGGPSDSVTSKIANLRHQLESYHISMAPLGDHYELADNTTLDKLEPDEVLPEVRQIADDLFSLLRGDFYGNSYEYRQNNESATARYTSVNPKSLENMPGAVDILVRIPLSGKREGIHGTASYDPELYTSSHYPTEGKNLVVHLRGYEETVNGEKVFHVFEIQSDWAQARREWENNLVVVQRGDGMWIVSEKDNKNAQWSFALETEQEAKQAYNELIKSSGASRGRFGFTPAHALLHSYERLALKAAIEHARSIGAKAIAISDAETAMLSEGHDQAAQSRLRNEEINPGDIIHEVSDTFFNSKDYVKVITQELGMRLHYDKTIPKLAEELTGQKGQLVSFGEHKNAVEYPSSFAHDENVQMPATPRLRKDLIIKNPDGTPKTDVTARLYDISKLPDEHFSILGKDKATNRERGIFYQGPKGAIEYFAKTGKAIIYLMENADFSTLMHEMLHYYELNGMFTKSDIRALEDWLNVKQYKWERSEREKIARAFERYLYDNIAPTTGLRAIFAKMAQWMRNLYSSLLGSPLDIQITPEIRAVFDRMFVPAHKKGIYGKILTPGRSYQVRMYKGLPSVHLNIEQAGKRQSTYIPVDNIIRGEPLTSVQQSMLGQMLKYQPPSDEQVAKALLVKEKAKAKANKPQPVAPRLTLPFIGSPMAGDRGTLMGWAAAICHYGAALPKELVMRWHKPLARKVRPQGRIGLELNEKANRHALIFGRYYGLLYKLLDETLELSGGKITLPSKWKEQAEYRKANLNLNSYIYNTKGTAAFRKLRLLLLKPDMLQKLIDGGILDESVKDQLKMTDAEADIVAHIKELNIRTGLIMENLVQPDGSIGLITTLHENAKEKAKRLEEGEEKPTVRFKHEPNGNVMINMLNNQGYFLASQPEGSREFQALQQAIRDVNPGGDKISLEQIKELMHKGRERKSAMEIAKSLDFTPDAVVLKGQTGIGSRLVEIFNSRTYEYAASLVPKTLLRAAFVELFGQNEESTKKLIDNFVSEGGNYADADNLITALNGLPVFQPEYTVEGSTVWYMEQMVRTVAMVYKLTWLSAMALPNLLEPFGLTALYAGYGRYFKSEYNLAKAKVLGKHAEVPYEDLKQIATSYGAIGRLASNWLVSNGSLIKDLQRIFYQSGMKLNLGDFVNTRNEIVSAVTAWSITESMKDGKATSWDRFILQAFEFTPEEVDAMMYNSPGYLGINDKAAARKELDDLYEDYVRRFVERSQGTTSLPAQKSLAAHSPGWRGMMWFDMYGRKQFDRIARLMETMKEKGNPEMQHELMVRLSALQRFQDFTKTVTKITVYSLVASYMQYLMRALIGGRGFGEDEWKYDTARAAEKLVAGYMLSGYADAFFRALMSNKEMNLGAWITDLLPGVGAASDFLDLIKGEGAYKDYPEPLNRTVAWFKRNHTAYGYIRNIAAIWGFSNMDIKTKVALNRYYTRVHDPVAADEQQRFHGYMSQAQEEIKLKGLAAQPEKFFLLAVDVNPERYKASSIADALNGYANKIKLEEAEKVMSTEDYYRLMDYKANLKFFANQYK